MEKLNIEIDTIYFNNDGIDIYTTFTRINGKITSWSNTENVEEVLPDVLKHLGYEVTVKKLFNGE